MLLNLQAMRAFAALLVVTVHLEDLLAGAGLAVYGHGGVDLFFVISGFIMAHTTRPDADPARFLANRFVRVAPLYWLITLAVFALAAAAPALLQSTGPDLVQLLKSLLFIPFEKASGHVQPIFFLGWTLNYEMFFYACFALSLLAPSRRIGLGLLVAGMTGLAVAGEVFKPTGVLAVFYTGSVLLDFVFGILLALGLKYAPTSAPWQAKLALIGAAAIAFGILTNGALAEPGGAPRAIYAGLPSAVIVAAAVLLDRWNWRVTAPAIVLLGDASYSLYLTHPFVTQAFQRGADLLGLTGWAALAVALCAVAAACSVAIASYRLLERPLTAWARRMLPEKLPAIPSRRRAAFTK